MAKRKGRPKKGGNPADFKRLYDTFKKSYGWIGNLYKMDKKTIRRTIKKAYPKHKSRGTGRRKMSLRQRAWEKSQGSILQAFRFERAVKKRKKRFERDTSPYETPHKRQSRTGASYKPRKLVSQKEYDEALAEQRKVRQVKGKMGKKPKHWGMTVRK